MDLNQLKIFLMVAEELHFGRAADRLHMAQPPVSRAIAQLERSLDTKLFDRNTRSVRLTDTGIQLVQSARKVVTAVKELDDRIQAAKAGDIGQLKIVFAGVSTHKLIGDFSRSLQRRYPGIKPQFESHRFAIDALRSTIAGETDLVLGRWESAPPTIESLVIMEEKLVLAVPASHRLAGAESVSMRELKDESFIELGVFQSVLQDRLLSLAHKAGFEPNVVHRSPETWTALALVAAEVGVSLTLDSVQANVYDANLRFIPISDKFQPIHLQMGWLRTNTNPVMPRAIEVALEAWGLTGSSE